MNTNYSENNCVTLIGKVASDKRLSHETFGEKFYLFDLEVMRLSDIADIIPITVSERLLTDFDLSIGNQIIVDGQFRSYNNYENEKNRLVLTVFAKDIQEYDKVKEQEETTEQEDEENEGTEKKGEVTNEIVLIGYICKKPIYRQTPFGREIADILLAVNRAYNKSDYIPCIAWGRNARFCQNIEVGTEIKITGRIQSRTYEKKFEDGTSETRVAYEISIASMEVIEENETADEETPEVEE